jgi:hypothetical protein
MDEKPLNPRKRLKLYKALKIAYMRGNQKRQRKILKRYGYRLDTDLSNPRETLVAYNPFDKKVLFVSNGTDKRSEKDLITDVGLAIGGLKQSERFMDTKDILTKAKDKYKGSKFVLAGSSLGGSLVNSVASPTDKVLTYNTAYLPRSKAQPNVKNYRTSGDVVSYFSPKENTTILKPPPTPAQKPAQPNDNVVFSTLKQVALAGAREGLTKAGFSAIPATAGAMGLLQATEALANRAGNLLKVHSIENIKGQPIFV